MMENLYKKEGKASLPRVTTCRRGLARGSSPFEPRFMERRMTTQGKKKSTYIQMRITPERKAAIRAKARNAGLSVTELIDQALDRTRVWSPEDKQAARERLAQLARIGNNLNQIARWCNAHKSGADALMVVAHLKAIEDELKCISNT